MIIHEISRICKSSMSLLAIAFLFLILVSDGEAQITFSTGWGKRNQDMRIRSSNTNCLSQDASLDQLLKLYSFIQIEARRILDCQILNK
ncbi:hypothetical protein P5V15_005450 [Pogonomyrmex californicus]